MSRNCEHFSGYFSKEILINAIFDEEGWIHNLYIERVMYSNPATIVFWNDGTKTISKCNKLDKYNPQIGLFIAVLKKFGGSGIGKLYDEWWPTKGGTSREVVTVSDVRNRARVADKVKEDIAKAKEKI